MDPVAEEGVPEWRLRITTEPFGDRRWEVLWRHPHGSGTWVAVPHVSGIEQEKVAVIDVAVGVRVHPSAGRVVGHAGTRVAEVEAAVQPPTDLRHHPRDLCRRHG